MGLKNDATLFVSILAVVFNSHQLPDLGNTLLKAVGVFFHSEAQYPKLLDSTQLYSTHYQQVAPREKSTACYRFIMYVFGGKY